MLIEVKDGYGYVPLSQVKMIRRKGDMRPALIETIDGEIHESVYSVRDLIERLLCCNPSFKRGHS
jgi:hypothetical protein